MLLCCVASAATVAGTALPVAACPLCESETGDEVRAGIFNEDFVPTLAAGLLPFAVIGLVVAGVCVDWSGLCRGVRERGRDQGRG